MRAYFFGNMYLSSIQQGIQAAHAVHEMFVRFPERNNQGDNNIKFDGDFLWEWATEHKTMILLNGGYAATIQELVDFFNDGTNPYPWADFHEEEASLNGALTTVGIILPEKIYLTAAAIRRNMIYSMNESGQTTVREQVWDYGSITVDKENDFGFDVPGPTIMVFSKWEAQMMDKLNQFNLAS